MQKNKIICDLVHGYIKICPNTETIINSESFQRLKFINQLTANHLYPSANHTRFEHSLGVMKLSLDFFNKIKGNLRYLIIGRDTANAKEEIETTKKIHNLRIHLQYAALLHDVGHAPLSHVGEELFDKKEIENKIYEVALGHDLLIKKTDFANGSAHELMSCYIILRKFYESLLAIHEFDFSLIFRIITGSKYSDEACNWTKNILITIVNSDTIDVDKIDYLMRDNHMTNYVGSKIDIERLLESLTVTKNKKLSFKPVGLSALQKVIDCRDSLYLWVCNHHTVVYTDYLYQECLRHMIRLKNEFDDKYPECLNQADLFSCDAIAEKNVTDNEALYYIRRAANIAKEGKSSEYTKKLVTQLLDRNFLKPAWKTLFEYTSFIKERFDDDERNEIIDYIVNDSNNRSKIVKEIIKLSGTKLGEVFLIVKPNKFYCSKSKQFFIYHDKKNTFLSKLLPPRDYTLLYDEIAFYLYCKKDKMQKVKQCFVKIMKNRARL